MAVPKFPELEVDMLARWDAEHLFEQTLKKTASGEPFVFFEGPPTANGKPGIHHALARAYKDVIPRYQTMRGRCVDRKAGWDTHGLPVELQVEKSLGISGKQQIENIVAGDARASVIAFNKQCKESVWAYLDEWQKFTRRLGYWVDMDHPYVTYENEYIESLWSVLARVHERGLLYRGHKVVPHCSRCGTALSSHEVALGYESTTEDSVVVRFKLLDASETTYVLCWTTTPWTLPGNVALAVGADVQYAHVRAGDAVYIVAEALVEKIFADIEHTVIKTELGASLVGRVYEPMFPFLALQFSQEQRARAFHIYASDFVTTKDGTGVVHTAVMYGEDDYQLGMREQLPAVHTVAEDGTFLPFVTLWAGKFVKSVEQEIIADLRARGLLFSVTPYTHDYPFCWRCHTPLLYYAKNSWFIKMSTLADELQKRNEIVTWVPEHIRDGRFGEWLRGIKDWAISRERYWGTPLPVWECASCGAFEVFASREALRARGALTPEDLHRPYIDDVRITCACGGQMQRVKEVMDVWFDSGAMFVAQWGYQFGTDGTLRCAFETHFPADYIAEAIDQTRGWFYTLLAVATLLELPAPYKHVVCLGHILDAKGKKMSKSVGNVVDPWDIFNTHGSDALRFHLFSMNQAGDVKLFDPREVGDVVKKVFLPLWNVLEFYKLYASQHAPPEATASDDPLDRWMRARTSVAHACVTTSLDEYDVTSAARELSALVTDISTWYVRRSRERCKHGGADAAAVVATLRSTLRGAACLFAPFTPMFADALFRELEGAGNSVHLQDWPSHEAYDENILREMDAVRVLVSQALEQRASAGIPVRQVLCELTVPAAAAHLERFFTIITEELNVERVAVGDVMQLNTTITPELKAKGVVRNVVRHINAARKARRLTQGEHTAFEVRCDEATGEIIERERTVIEQATSCTITVVIGAYEIEVL